VGTASGGDFSGIEVTDNFLPSSGATCFTTPAHVIPDTVAIGDTITQLSGAYIDYCPAGTTCPPSTSEQFDVAAGTFVVGAHGMAPTPADVTVADITGTALAVGPRDMALQGSLVHLSSTTLAVAPSATNHNVMMVYQGAMTTPTMAVSVTKYTGVTTQRNTLAAQTPGTAVGDVTGVLQYAFGQWIIQLRQPADLPSVH